MGKELYEIGELPPVGEVPAKMHAQVVRPDRFGEPEQAIQDEVIDVPELGPHDALVMVMAGGVNFNNVWAARGVPVDVDEDAGAVGRADGLPHRRLRRERHRVRGRRRRDEREGRRPRRRARRSVGSGRPEGEGGPRSRARGLVPRLGLRHVLGFVRAVHQGAGAPVPAQGRLPHLGGGRGADAHRQHGLPDALRLAAERRRAGRRRPGVGRLRRARLARDPAGGERRRPRRRRRRQRREGRVLQDARRGGVRQPQGLHALGRPAGVGLAGVEDLVRRRQGVRQGDLGRARRAQEPADRVRASRRRTRSPRRTSCATAAA